MREKVSAGVVIGVPLLAFGGQGAIRLLVDHDNSGVLGWMPGGFAAWLTCYVMITLAGVLLASWGSARAKRNQPR
jgi:hypothetical protein